MIEPYFYSIDFNIAVWVLLGAMLVWAVMVAAVLWPKLRRVSRKVYSDTDSEMPSDGYPPVSVIVYAQSQAHNLRVLLPQILNQDYPAPMEVIVVNDESADNTETIVSELGLQYPNLYMTFAPEHSRSLSRRKLSITLGVKAARYEAMVFTCGNCRIDSALWLRSMTRHIATGSQVVLGYATLSGCDGSDEDEHKRRRAFDHVWASVRWISPAMSGRPFMGTAFNMAYSRSLFFAHKGFSRTLSLKYGDDDVFVNEIAHGGNTAVELGLASRVTAIEHAPAQMSEIYELRRSFTRQYLPSRPYRVMSSACVAAWLWIVCGVAASVMSWPSLVPMAAVAVTGMAVVIPTAFMWRRTSVALGSRRLLLTVPWLLLTHPFRQLRRGIRARASRTDHFTYTV